MTDLMERYFRIREYLELRSKISETSQERLEYMFMLYQFDGELRPDRKGLLELVERYELKTLGKTLSKETSNGV